MNYIKKIVILLLLPLTGIAQNDSLLIVEQQLKIAFHKAYPACVRAYGVDSSTRLQNSAQFSAVVVSADGIMLTVAHAVMPGQLYKISFPGGKSAFAKALGRIATNRQTLRPDVAMMQITENGPWPFVEMGSSARLFVGQLCFGISYPESHNLMTPMLRFGSILNSLNEWGFVESSCIMETGDSGGPLFDEQGRVVALHSRIDKPEGANYEVPVDLYRKYFTALHLARDYDSLPVKTDDLPAHTAIPEHKTSLQLNDLAAWIPGKIKDKAGNAVVQITSLTDTICGTVFQLANGKQFIISKSSQVADNSFTWVNDRQVPLKVVQRDKERDLVALSLAYRFPQPIAMSKLNTPEAKDCELTGTFLYTPLPQGEAKTSVYGLTVQELPNRFSSGGFNAYLQEQNGCPTITKVDSGGSAEKAGLKHGDCVFRINGVAVNGAKDFNNEMMKYYPGDSVRFSVRRNTDTLTVALVLTPRILLEQNHPMNRFNGSKSVRRDGFRNVILHDARLRSYQCGSPLYDFKGNLIGLNIARFSHTTAVALEISEVLSFIKAI